MFGELYAIGPYAQTVAPGPWNLFSLAMDGEAPAPVEGTVTTLVGRLPELVSTLDSFVPEAGSIKGGQIDIPVKFVQWHGPIDEIPARTDVYIMATLPALRAGKYQAKVRFIQYRTEDGTKIEGPDADAPALVLFCDFEVRPAAKPAVAEKISWGVAVNGLRVGLAPEKIVVGPKETTLKVRLCYENTGKEPRKIPVHGNRYINCFRVMFATEKGGKTSYAYWNLERRKTSCAEEKELGAGEKFEEIFLLTLPYDLQVIDDSKPGVSEFILPELRAGESLKLFFGLFAETDPGEKSWALAGTVKSGGITVTRAAE
jgi:hypothetical protein